MTLLKRWSLTVYPILTLLILLVPTACLAGNLAVTVVPEGEFAEIGRDLVLKVIITPTEDMAFSPDDLDIGDWVLEVTSPGADGLFGSPYPLKILLPADLGETTPLLTGQVALEWAAPISVGTSPAEHQIQVVATAFTTEKQEITGQWVGEIRVDYGQEWSPDRITDFIARKGLGFFLLLVFGFGILMSLSPCIYPMIPITLAVIGTRSQEKGALHGLTLSITYVLGMAMVYAIMGALSATVFSGINAFMQSPVVLVPIALLLVALSFSMFGAYELEAPRFLRDRLQSGGGNRGGVLGVFAMGMVAGLVASPCVGPFLAALLVWVATTGNWVLGFFSLFTFGIGMGLLLIGVGTFPALLGSMPQSGGWMETIRKSMGLLLVAMAFFFVRPGLVLPEKVFLPLVGGSSVILAIFLGAFDPMGPASSWWDRTRKSLGLIVLLAGTMILIGSFLSLGLLPLDSYPGSTTSDRTAQTQLLNDRSGIPSTPGQQKPVLPILPDKVQWQVIHTGENVKEFLGEQLQLAKKEGKPVLLDFWGSWCKLCLVLDKKVWIEPQVVAEAQRFVTIKVDATKMDAEMESIFEEYQVAGQPTIVFIDSRGEVLLGRNSNFKPADQMLKLMQTIR
ncbi:MAG: thioredoxin family protein [Gemmatimonadales bacterium]|nr:thioredoxin family protein [Gemmatimonadales bacterium]